MKNNILEIAIPTYNRTIELKKCLYSILVATRLLSQSEKKNIGIAINDNSTIDFFNRKKIISKYKKKFESSGIGYFKYCVTGFNIGSNNNFATLLINSQSDYTWILPDDDVARFDSIKTILKTIRLHKPCFINGGWEIKSQISYNEDILENDDNLSNNLKKILNGKNKINYFLSKNIVQLQEYVYKTSHLKKFFLDDKNITLINNMNPALYAIYCMLDNGPSVLLTRSLGIFRIGEPNSDWRHLFHKRQLKKSINVYRQTILNLSFRPDILLGINRKYELSFFKLFYYHRTALLKSLAISVPMIFFKIYQKIKRDFF